MTWEQRFQALVERKQREAAAARICPMVTVHDRSAEFDVDPVGNPWTHSLFDGPLYASRGVNGCTVNLVFVTSREGNTAAKDPGDLGGGEADKHLIYEGLSRVHVDAVMAGAHTVVGEEVLFSVWHPELVRLRTALGKPRHPTQVVVSTQHAVTVRDELLFNVPTIPAILITTDAEAEAYASLTNRRAWVDVIGTGSSIDMGRGLETLARVHGVRTVSCVGGRTTAAALIAGGLVDDLYLTTSPHSGGEPDTRLHTNGRHRNLVLRKQGSGTDAGVVFEHWKLRG
jgi:riboflavin biosynthesis pyrimidine reductase